MKQEMMQLKGLKGQVTRSDSQGIWTGEEREMISKGGEPKGGGSAPDLLPLKKERKVSF